MSYWQGNIGRIVYGDYEIAKAYYGSDLVFQKSKSTMIPYLRNTDLGAYIDTGITPDSTTRIVLWARNISPITSYVWVFGARIASNNSAFAMYLPSHTYYKLGDICCIYSNLGEKKYANAFKYLSGYHKYELYGGKLYVDDNLVISNTASAFSCPHNIHLFGLNNNGSHVSVGEKIDICACKIYKNNVLVRDYTAVKSPSVGLYDSVSNTIFTNAGSGELTYGVFSSDAYIPLEYIELTNSQWFDSGVCGSNKMDLVCKLRVVGTSVGWNTPFGTMISNQNGSYYIVQFTNSTYPNAYCNTYINTTTLIQAYSNTGSRLTNRDIVYYNATNQIGLIENDVRIGNPINYSRNDFTTQYNIYVGTTSVSGSPSSGNAFYGRIYYLEMGREITYVPALVNGVAGLYDTYNDVFHPSESGTPFVAGPTL